MRVRRLTICLSKRAKKNVLFFWIGPPTLPVSWFRLYQFGRVGGPGLRLLAHVFALSAEFWMFHTALPANLLVPERVRIWICALPRPSSASTGERINRISPTRSGLITFVVITWRPQSDAESLELTVLSPLIVALTVSRLRPPTVD